MSGDWSRVKEAFPDINDDDDDDDDNDDDVSARLLLRLIKATQNFQQALLSKVQVRLYVGTWKHSAVNVSDLVTLSARSRSLLSRSL